MTLRVSRLSVDQVRAYETAVGLWAVRGTPLEVYDLERCPATIKRGKGRNIRFVGKQCTRRAGQGTWHEGYGNCVAHGGAKKFGRALGAWLMAHRFAEELDCTPWEGLLRAVRIAAGKVAYCQWVIGQASDDLELEGRFGRGEDGLLVHPDTLEPLGVGAMRDRSWWVGKEELWTDRLAKYSKAAIDAGVAQILLEQQIQQGENVALVLGRTLDALDDAGIPADTLAVIRGIMAGQLRAMGSEEGSSPVAIEGSVVKE